MGVGADEDVAGSGTHEAIDQVLRECAVDLCRCSRSELEPVQTRVEDVDVEPVLVRGVTEPAEAGTEVAAVRPAEIADPDARRLGMRGSELGRHR